MTSRGAAERVPTTVGPRTPRRATHEREADALARLAKGLAHPARVQILALLARRTTCMCGEIVLELPLAQSTVSEHLRILKQAGLIRGRIDGPRRCYCLDRAALARVRRLVERL